MRSEALVGVIAILVIASLGAGYLAGSGVRQTEPRTVTSVATSTMHTGQPIQAADVEAASISLGGASDLAVDVNASRVYVERFTPASMSYSLTVIDTSSDTVVANFTLPSPTDYNPAEGGSSCSDLVVDDSTGTVYVIYAGEIVAGEIVAVNSSNDAVIGEVPVSLGALAPFTCVPSLDTSTNVLWGTATYPEPGQPKGLVGSVIGVNVLTGSVVEDLSLGFAAGYAVVDPYTGMVYVDGCTENVAYVCDTEQLAIINGTSGSLVTTVNLNDPFYPHIALDPSTDVVYVTGGSQLVAVNGTNGNVIFRVYPETCGPSSIAVIPSTDQVLMASINYPNYLSVYDGANGTLVNMYSFPSNSLPYFEGYDAGTGELYVSVFVGAGADLLALHDVQATGNVNATLIDVGCGPPDD